MSTIMTEQSTQHISTMTQRVEARALDITSADQSTIAWESSPDLGVAFQYAQDGKGVRLPHHSEGGIVVVALDPEDDHFAIHEVVTERTTHRDDVEVIDRAIAVLQQLRAGLVAAQGGAR